MKFWKAENGKEYCTVRVTATLSREEAEYLIEFGKNCDPKQTLHDLLNDFLSQGMCEFDANGGENYNYIDPDKEDEGEDDG